MRWREAPSLQNGSTVNLWGQAGGPEGSSLAVLVHGLVIYKLRMCSRFEGMCNLKADLPKAFPHATSFQPHDEGDSGAPEGELLLEQVCRMPDSRHQAPCYRWI